MSCLLGPDRKMPKQEDVENRSDSKKLEIYQNLRAGEVFLREPVKIGVYSLEASGSEKIFHDDCSQLKYLHLPATSDFAFDLTDGYSDGKVWGQVSSEGLTHLLTWILKNRSKFKLSTEEIPGSRIHTDFVAYRGLFTYLLCTPYERNEDWILHAVKFNGTIYMDMQQTESRKSRLSQRSDYESKLCYGGFRFEQYICSNSKTKSPPSQLVDNFNDNQFCAVFRSRLNSHSLAFGAEMDCIEPDDSRGMKFVEIKTTPTINSKRQHDNFLKYKCLKWWAQSYLVGINKVICGYRDQDLFVRKIEAYSVKELPKMSQEYWSPNVCLNFLDSFLTFVKTCVIKEDCNITYQFSWAPGKEIISKELEMKRSEMLPDWYCDAFS